MRLALVSFFAAVMIVGGTACFAIDSCSECREKRLNVGGNTYVYEYCVRSLSGTVPNCQTVEDGAGNATCQAVWPVSGNCDYGVSPIPNTPISRDPSDGGQWTDKRVHPGTQTVAVRIAETSKR